MQELEKILEEIEAASRKMVTTDMPHKYYKAVGTRKIEEIIRKHMNDSKCGNCSRRKWYQIGFKDGLKSNDDWISVEERMPEEGQEVWVSTKTDCVRRGTYTRHFGAEHREGFICSDGFIRMNTVNVWQSYVVPEPYRPERIGV